MYQRRQLLDGSTHEVLKNFPDRAGLNASLSAYCSGITPDFMRYYWRLAADFNQ